MSVLIKWKKKEADVWQADCGLHLLEINREGAAYIWFVISIENGKTLAHGHNTTLSKTKLAAETELWNTLDKLKKKETQTKMSLKKLLSNSPQTIKEIWLNRKNKNIVIYTSNRNSENPDDVGWIEEMIDEEMCDKHNLPNWKT